MLIATLGDGIELRLLELRHLPACYRLLKVERVGEEWVDNLIYGMLEEEWRAQQQTRQA